MSERLAPEVKGIPLLGQLLTMRENPLRFMVEVMCRHGGLVRVNVGPRVLHLVTHPDHVQEILQQKHRSFTKKTAGMAQLSLLVGNGLLTSDGEFWRRQRRIAQPAFHKDHLRSFADRMVQVAQETGERWHQTAASGDTLDVDDEMMRATLAVVSRTLISADVSREAAAVDAALDYLLLEIRKRLFDPFHLPLAIPTPGNVKFKRAVETIDTLVVRVIAERRSGQVTCDDLLQMLIEAVDEETGESMTDLQLRDEVVTMFIAGHETTASALAWTWFCLSTHPAVRERLWQELDGVLAGRAPTIDDLPRLPYLGQVLNESLRLFPPAWVIARQTAEPVEIGGYHIPEDHTVLIVPYAIHRSAEFWENPLGFDPDRFAGERTASHHRYQFFPFGAGTRMCIGKGFALIEAKLILAHLAQTFRLDLAPDHTVEPQATVTLRPRDGIQMHVHERQSGHSIS